MLKTQLARAAAITLAVALFAPAAGATPILNTLGGEDPIVIAHRGASGYLPEHTLGAYELAVQLGADYIEPDLQFTSDGVLVAMHDDTLDRTTNVEELFAPRNGGYAVSDFTLAEIKSLTVTPTGTASSSYPGFIPTSVNPVGIPTFQEVIDLVADQSALTGRAIGIYPEAKQADPAMEDAILQTLTANGYGSADDKVFIQSFSAGTIQSLHAKQEAASLEMQLVVLGVAVTLDIAGELTPVLGLVSGTIMTFAEVAAFADGLGILINNATYAITEEWISAAHAAGLLVHGWTFAQPDPVLADADYQKYLAMGMDGMFSNYPDLAVTARDEFLVAVPEPASAGLLAAGLGGILLLARRARRGERPARA